MTISNEKDKILAIAPYTLRLGPGRMVGDLYITEKMLYYIPLFPIDDSSGSAAVVKGSGAVYGALTGGIVGALLGSAAESMSGHFEAPNREEYFRVAVSNAYVNRKKQYGFSLQERIDNSAWKDCVAAIPRESIKEHLSEEQNGELWYEANDEVFLFSIPEEVHDRLTIVKIIRGYIEKGTEFALTYTKDDDTRSYQVIKSSPPLVEGWPMPDFGINLGCLTPQQFVDALKNGENLPLEKIAGVLDNKDYLAAFYPLFSELPNSLVESSKFCQINIKIGNYLCDSDNYKEADKYFKRVLKVDSQNFDALSGRGESLQGQGALYDARKWYAKALSVNPDSASTWLKKDTRNSTVYRMTKHC
jgi:hypothetical protein